MSVDSFINDTVKNGTIGSNRLTDRMVFARRYRNQVGRALALG